MPSARDNSTSLVPGSGRPPASMRTGYGETLPALFLRSADRGKRFWEFFTAHIRNRNTRRAYFVGVAQFSDWCEVRQLALEQVQPIHVAAYIEQLGQKHSKPTVK